MMTTRTTIAQLVKDLEVAGSRPGMRSLGSYELATTRAIVDDCRAQVITATVDGGDHRAISDGHQKLLEASWEIDQLARRLQSMAEDAAEQLSYFARALSNPGSAYSTPECPTDRTNVRELALKAAELKAKRDCFAVLAEIALAPGPLGNLGETLRRSPARPAAKS